jgi:hypothetical protein
LTGDLRYGQATRPARDLPSTELTDSQSWTAHGLPGTEPASTGARHARVPA